MEQLNRKEWSIKDEIKYITMDLQNLELNEKPVTYKEKINRIKSYRIMLFFRYDISDKDKVKLAEVCDREINKLIIK
jgi:hypothetical protein